MTVLTIAIDVADQVGVAAPTSLVSPTTKINKLFASLLRAELKHLRTQRVFVPQKKSYSFSLVSGQNKYQLPEDFYSCLPSTEWDRNRRWPLIGPLSDPAMNQRLYGVVNTSRNAFRIFGPDMNPYSTTGGQFQVYPTPTASGDVLSFDYVTKNLYIPPNWTPTTSLTLNTYVNASGNIYKVVTAGTSSSTPPSHTSGNALNGTAVLAYISAPYETVLSDSDNPLFDEELVTAGLKWRYLKSKGQDYQLELKEHNDMIDAAVTRFFGSFVGRMDRPVWRGPRYSVPDGGWSV